MNTTSTHKHNCKTNLVARYLTKHHSFITAFSILLNGGVGMYIQIRVADWFKILMSKQIL